MIPFIQPRRLASSASAKAGERREPTVNLIREALDETRELVRLEVALAKAELGEELGRVKTGAMAFGFSAAAGLCGVTLLLVAAAAAFMPLVPLWLAALVGAVLLLAAAGAMALVGWRALPKSVLSETRQRVAADIRQLRERVV